MSGRLVTFSRRKFGLSAWIVLVWLHQAYQVKSFYLSSSTSSRNAVNYASTNYDLNQYPFGSKRLQLLLLSSPFPWERPLPSDGDEEETLLRMHLSVLPSVKLEDALEKVQRFTQSFPFAAVLPVQPLQYLPTHDGGVDVLFLRKKTEEKGSMDGGIRFFVRPDESEDLGGGIEILAKRNSQGQTVAKLFSERLVVQAYVKGVSGEEGKLYGTPPSDVVAVSSVFHKWM